MTNTRKCWPYTKNAKQRHANGTTQNHQPGRGTRSNWHPFTLHTDMKTNTHRIFGIRRDSYEPQQLMLPIILPPKRKAHPALFAIVYGTSTAIAIATILLIVSKFSN